MTQTRSSPAPNTRCGCGQRTAREIPMRTGRLWPRARPARATAGRSFDRDGAVELRVDENTAVRQNIGSAISASDADSNNLTYTLEGPGAGSFAIVSNSGQIRTKSSSLDYEARQSYSLTVKVDDGQRRQNSVAAKSVTITVDNVREAPSASPRPRQWLGYPARRAACASRGPRPRTRGLRSPNMTCSTAKSGAAPRGGSTSERTGARSSRN